MKENIRDILNAGKGKNVGQNERQEMLSVFHQQENEEEVKKALQNELEDFSLQDNSGLDYGIMFDRLWKRLSATEKQHSVYRRIIPSILKFAAVLVIGLLVGAYVVSLQFDTEPLKYAAHSPKGSISDVLLPDGSEIYLNADSRITYQYNRKKGVREITLNGEAWFEVQKDKKKPFIVRTSHYAVEVTGTAFNVKAYENDDRIVTTLEDGEVKLVSSDNFKINEDIILEPGEQAVLHKSSNRLTVANVNTKRYTAWKNNKLIFINMDMSDLIVILERRYGVDIDVENKNLLQLHFNGTIKNESIIEVLEIIKTTLPIDYKIEGQEIKIISKQE